MSNEIKVALSVLFAIVAIYGGIRFLSGQPLFGGGYEIVAEFSDAQGLAPGSVVRLNGVRVGDVSRVGLGDNARKVYVTMAIEPGVEIPRGSTIQTSGLSAIGEVNVEITPPQGADAGRPLVAGDTLIASEVPDLFDLLAGQSNSLTARADTALIGAVNTFTSLDRILTNSGDDVTAVLAQLRFLTTAATTTLLAERERIGRTLNSLEAAAANASAVSSDVGNDVRGVSRAVGDDLLATSRTVRGVAETNADSVAIVVNGLNTSLRRLDQNLATLNRLTSNLDSTITGVREADGTLSLLLTDPSLYQNANAAAASLQQILQDFQNDPQRYLRDFTPVRVF
ncbi:MAG TPA: MlaD family protein [Rubricoccaceae bacterium]|jgi:phospholipid/cholesterol/gamma-HCH transport system substrate-binding protein